VEGLKRTAIMRAFIALMTVTVLLVALLAFSAPALAYDESKAYPDPLGHSGPYTECLSCHGGAAASDDCMACHGPPLFPESEQYGRGPHAGYTTGSERCSVCHTIHDAAGNYALLPEPTILATCETCHDGTGGKGVYGAILARTGVAPGQQHRMDTTRTVPGGNPTTGGSIDATFTGPNNTLTCTDCHNPHDADTVAAYPGERRRVPYSRTNRESWQALKTNRLLRKHPGGSTETVEAYGSDWCIACHKGRMSGTAVHNHPVDSTATAGAEAFTYANVAITKTESLTTETVMGQLADSNRGYLMPDPRTAQQGTHFPICQQCHEDSRDVGVLTTAGADPATFTVSLDGTVTTSNPRFLNFPHETQNQHMLVETGDNLCLNCHAVLP